MIIPPLSLNENDRLKALNSYHLLDTLPEEDFDNITYLASVICQTPISIISLIDQDRQFFKSHLGIDINQTHKDLSFCAHAINQPQAIFEIEDARLDERFHDNDFVIGKPNIAFYAGVPLVDTDGFALGTLCVVDQKPRKLTDEQKEALTKLSKQVMLIIEARQKKLLEKELKLVEYTFKNASIPIYYVLEDASIYDFNDIGAENLGYTSEELHTLKIFDLDKDYDEKRWSSLWAKLKAKKKITVETQQKKKDGTLIDVIITANYVKYGDLELNCSYVLDITEKKKQDQQMALVDFVFRNSTTPINILNEDASIFDFNDAANQLLGYTKEEYKAITIPDLDPSYQLDIWPIHWEELKKAKSLSFETTLKKKNGDILNANIEANFIQYGNKELNCVFFTDITEKKKLEDNLKLSAFTIENAAWGLVYFKADGTIYNCNHAFAKMYGYTSLEDVKTKSVFDFSTDYTTETWKQYWDNLREKKSLQFVAKRTKKDGTIIDVEINPNMIQFGDLELNCAFVYDVTNKLKAEDDLKQSNQRYEYATLATSDVIWEEDLLKNEIFISKNFTTFFGHPVDDGWMPIENNIWRQNINRDDFDNVMKESNAVFNSKQSNNKWVGEYRLRKADGNYATVIDKTFAIKDEEGRIVRMVGAMQDITKQRAEEERLRLMESVILNTNDAILITEAEPIDLPGPRILFVNKAFTEMTGYSAEEVIGKTPRIMQNEDTDRKELDRLYKSLKNWEPCEVTVSNSRKNGEKFWLNMRITPIAIDKGWFTHWIAVERDVTKQKEADEEKEKLLKELVENNLELKQFSYITTHNFRAPLTNLVSICDIIQPGTGTDALTLQLIDSFKTSTHHLNETLNDLIDVLIIKENRHIQKDQLTFEDIFKKISESLSMSLLEKKVKIHTDFSTASSVIFATSYLESIFLNLITNAIKYRHPDRDPIIEIKTNKEPNGDTKLMFSDNGIGINMAIAKDKLFGLYKRFHDNTDSKGIGLYLIHSQITTLGGKIEVESEVNIGTTFTIIFK
jgi:PAS domain S-box-containing protein